MVNGKCREFVDKITRLIAKEVEHTFDGKIFVISLSGNKTFLAKRLLDDNGNGTVELLHGE